ncbi:MAG: hypothetical protein AB1491_02990 [Thermodesulfobacteriota bacterium]
MKRLVGDLLRLTKQNSACHLLTTPDGVIYRAVIRHCPSGWQGRIDDHDEL